jgi:hypothetical protein
MVDDATPRASLEEIVRQRYGWSAPIRLPQLWEPLCGTAGQVTFAMLVAAREQMWDGMVQAEALAVSRLLRERFEHQHGVIQNSFFCRYARGGCAVTERTTGTGRRARPVRALHSVLNSSASQLVTLEAGCTVLADNAVAAFAQQPRSGANLRVATDRTFSVMTRVLGAADTWAQPDTTHEERLAAVEAARAEYAVTSRTVNASIQRQARFVYFQGVLLGAVITVAVCSVIGALDAAWWSRVVSPAALVAATVFGALGALASVFQRMSTGNLVLDFSATRGQLVILGGVRPFIGALFGAVIQFFLFATVLGPAAPDRSAASAFATFAITGFAAGFSERFATDMIERAGTVITGVAPAPPATRTKRAKAGRQAATGPIDELPEPPRPAPAESEIPTQQQVVAAR